MNKLVPLLELATACQHRADSTPSFHGLPRDALPELARHDFNRLASMAGVPLYWHAPPCEPSSFVTLGVSTTRDAPPYIIDGRFTPSFDALYARLVNQRRIEAVETELRSGRLVAVTTDFSEAPATDRAVVRAIAEAAEIIEESFSYSIRL